MIAAATSRTTTPPTGTRTIAWGAVAQVAATYIFFLLFAQFGFLQGVRDSGHESALIHGVLGAMAGAGIGASIIAPRMVARLGAGIVVAAGLAVCELAGWGAAAAFGWDMRSVPALTAVSCLTGTGLGLATVGLASDLRRLTGGLRVGLHAGLGTAVAYFACNLPFLFPASPTVKSIVAAVIAGSGGAVAWIMRDTTGASRLGERQVNPSADRGHALLPEAFLRPTGLALAVAAFLALVWFDSAAFAVVQNTEALRARLWHGNATLWINGSVHVAAAIAAGFALDRRAWRASLGVALALLVAGSLLFAEDGAFGALAGPVYIAGVSIYSTALAVFAALAPAAETMPSPAVRAAWIYGVAGWFGSVAGVGLAEQMGVLPAWAAPAAAIVFAFAMAASLVRPSDRLHTRFSA